MAQQTLFDVQLFTLSIITFSQYCLDQRQTSKKQANRYKQEFYVRNDYQFNVYSSYNPRFIDFSPFLANNPSSLLQNGSNQSCIQVRQNNSLSSIHYGINVFVVAHYIGTFAIKQNTNQRIEVLNINQTSFNIYSGETKQQKCCQIIYLQCVFGVYNIRQAIQHTAKYFWSISRSKTFQVLAIFRGQIDHLPTFEQFRVGISLFYSPSFFASPQSIPLSSRRLKLQKSKDSQGQLKNAEVRNRVFV